MECQGIVSFFFNVLKNSWFMISIEINQELVCIHIFFRVRQSNVIFMYMYSKRGINYALMSTVCSKAEDALSAYL